jgi:hypothetical protein
MTLFLMLQAGYSVEHNAWTLENLERQVEGLTEELRAMQGERATRIENRLTNVESYRDFAAQDRADLRRLVYWAIGIGGGGGAAAGGIAGAVKRRRNGGDK